ncbi:citrate synthase, mitochondrial [Tanacetum coccineum]
MMQIAEASDLHLNEVVKIFDEYKLCAQYWVKNPWPNVDAHSGVLLNYYGLTEARPIILITKSSLSPDMVADDVLVFEVAVRVERF